MATAGSDAQEMTLTDREQEVLICLMEGMAYKQVATHLEISIDTVRTHIRRIYRKLRVHSGTEAVTRGSRRGSFEYAGSQ